MKTDVKKKMMLKVRVTRVRKSHASTAEETLSRLCLLDRAQRKDLGGTQVEASL